MRCPDCNKFTSMDNGDVEVNNLEVSPTDNKGNMTISYSMRGVRTCADCGTELKSLDMDGEEDFDITATDKWKELPKEEQDSVLKALDDADTDVDIEESGSEVEEGGGSRYQKNLITTVLNFTITVHMPDSKEYTFDGSLSEEHAASEYDECC